MKLKPLWTPLLVGVAIFVVLGHVCELPPEARAGVVTPHTEDHPGRDTDEEAHAGSCEALRASPDVDAPALQPTGTGLPIIGAPEIHRARPAAAPAPASSPPLFLLHAALLI